MIRRVFGLSNAAERVWQMDVAVWRHICEMALDDDSNRVSVTLETSLALLVLPVLLRSKTTSCDDVYLLLCTIPSLLDLS